MAKLLKVSHLSHQDRVANMNIRRCRIESGFYAQWFPVFLRPLEFLYEFLFANYLNCASPDTIELLLNRNIFEIVHAVWGRKLSVNNYTPAVNFTLPGQN